MRGVHFKASERFTMTQDSIVAAEEPRDRPFNPFRAPKSDKVKKVIAEFVRYIQNYERHYGLRRRKRKARDQETFEAIVSAVICDVVHRELGHPGSWIAVPLSKQLLGKKSRYSSPVLASTLPAVLECLAALELAYIEIRKGQQGFFNDGRQTTIRASRYLKPYIYGPECTIDFGDLTRLPVEEVIILKRTKESYWDGGGLVEYKDNRTTNKFRREVNQINEWLEEADISFDQYYDPNGSVDETDRHVKRYFCNGRFDHGGRLFGGFWQPLGKQRRREGILIQGEKTVTLDFGQMAPRILYSMAGEEPSQDDAYLLPGFEKHRAGVKKIFNALLFADKTLTRMPKGTRKLVPDRTSFNQVLNKLKSVHHPIEQFFFSGIGYQVQFVESEILVDVLLSLRSDRIVGLPVHDAVVVPQSQADRVQQTMESVFKQHTGIGAVVDIELP